MKPSQSFTATDLDKDGGEVRSIFAIKPKGMKRHAQRLRKAVPELDKQTSEKCAEHFCQMFVEEANALTVGLIETATVVAMRRIAIDVANLATKFELAARNGQIKKDMKQQKPKNGRRRSRKN